MSDVKYPHVKVQLSEGSGNAYVIIGTVRRALQRAGVPAAEVEEFVREAKSGDYDHVIETAMKTVDVD